MAVEAQACRVEAQQTSGDLIGPGIALEPRSDAATEHEQSDGARPDVLDATTRQMLAEVGEEVFVQRGEALFRAGDAADGLYVLINGRVRITHEAPSDAPEIVMEAGALVGAAGALCGGTRTYTAVAERDCRLIAVSAAAFETVSRRSPETTLALARRIVMQGERIMPGAAERTRRQAIAVVPAGPDVPVHTFAARLHGALEPHAASLLLQAQSLDRRLWPGASRCLAEPCGDSRIVGWLNEQERAHDVVLYETDASATAWTRRCLRQADRVLVVGRADAPPALGWLEAALAEEAATHVARPTLVLLQPSTRTQPAGTAVWLAAAKAESHHHVWMDRSADMARLARHLTGRAIGVVLGSGGARCFAHLGVLRALQEAAIPVDAIGGVSIGALIAAQMAQGGELQALLGQMRALACNARGLLGYTVPLVSLFNASRLDALLGELFSDRQIEDLALPFFCASSNLHTARLMVHRQGSLKRYLRASCAAPGLLPPVLDGGELLVDGAVRNAVPVHAMRALCEGGPVIASDVSAEISLRQDYRFGETPSAARVLWSRINPFARDRLHVPHIASIVMRAAELSSVHHGDAEVRTADLYIRPPVSRYRMFDCKHFETLVAHGYQCAAAAIEQWQRAGTMDGGATSASAA
jgi:predicted acylesterase/phospholipase RssA/CRP-like cAMP-binding protein